MSRRPPIDHVNDDEREARIRALRDQRDAPKRRRRRFQPLVLLTWFAAVTAFLGVVIFIGLLALSPALMDWVAAHPGTIENGLVQDFVQWYKPDALADVPAGEDGQRITVEVQAGTTDSEIGALLFSRGLIRSQVAFQWAVLEAGRAGDLPAGIYDLSPSLTPSQIVAALRKQPGPVVKITIIEGWRIEQMASYLAGTTLTLNVDQFADLALHPPADLLASYDFLATLPPGRSLEGYLFPDTYQVNANATARDVIEKLLDTFDLRMTQEVRDQIAAVQIGGQPMTIDQAVILASIVEREAVLDPERPLIAGVYLNRLTTKGWRMEADPTLQYGLATATYGSRPLRDWVTAAWWAPLAAGGVDIELPEALIGYQTYLNMGLPPTPISAPRLLSILAVANADRSAKYFFFVAGCPNGVYDGSHYFAKTLAEHNANVAKARLECPAP
jgi:UPF0755 protein